MTASADELLKAIGRVIPHTVDSKIFESPEAPPVFVNPAMEPEDEEHPFAAPVILIEAPAAVGKSTVAHYVASTAGIPLLNLARVPVAAGSLRGLIGGYIQSDPQAVDAFLSGDLALVIDALDEGRIRSGEDSFTEFLFTTWELVEHATDDSIPILVLFGRPTTVGDVEASLELHNLDRPADQAISYRRVKLAFFDEQGAVELVKQNARSLVSDPSRIDRQWGAISVAIGTYFNAIAKALGLEGSGDLWDNDLGRAFAGYAPVLGALGSLIAETADFQSLAVKLAQDFGDAWEPIEEVISLILDREVGKLQAAVQPLLSDSAELDAEIYGPDEQLSYLLDHVKGERVLEARVPPSLHGRDAEEYVEAVNQQIQEHPFVRERRFANPVFGGFVLAAAIERGLPEGPSTTSLISQASRSPFLWRSFKRRLADNGKVVSGSYLGYLLASRWNDPGVVAGRVSLSSDRRQVAVRFTEGPPDLLVTPPVRFFERIRDVSALLGDTGDATIELAGEALSVSGPVVLVAPEIRVNTEKVFLEGSVWIEANQFESGPNLSLKVDDEAEVGWNDTVADHYPWSHAETKLSSNPLAEPEPANQLEALIVAATRHAPSHSVVVEAGTLRVAQEEPRWSWIQREYGELFRLLLKLLIEEGLAGVRGLATSGSQKKARVTFAFRWSELAEVARGRPGREDLQNVLGRAQTEFPQRLLYP